MPIPVMTYSDPLLSQPIRPLPTTIGGLLGGIGQGVSLASQLQQMKQRAQLAPIQQQYLQGQIAEQPFHQRLLAAQAAKLQTQAQDPYGGQILPGPAGQAQGLQILKMRYGDDSPIYQNAKNAFAADLQLKLGRAQYFKANTALKNMPELNKLQLMESFQNEQDRRQSHGLSAQTFNQWSRTIPAPAATQPQPQPTISAALTPSVAAVAGQQQIAPAVGQVPAPAVQPPVQTVAGGITQQPFAAQAGQTGLGIVQKVVPKFVQQKMSFASNIEKTLDQMPDDAIKAYSENPVKMANDYKLSLQGKITPEYAKYQQYMVNAKMLATQIRQFYGDSVQPAMLGKIADLTNPISWRTNPKVALIKFNALKKTLGREMDTYRQQATDPKFYSGEKESSVLRGQNIYGQSTKAPTPTPSPQTMVRMRDRAGNYWNVPGDKVSQALNMGATRAE